jgi:hypothetical protein
MTPWQAVTWETARASGIVAYLLFTASVAVGLALTQQWQSARWPRLINAEMHNFLALVGLVFVGIHVIAITLDPFTHFSLLMVLVPFISTYRALWMGLGIVALYLGFAILISTWLRPRIGYTWWRRLHVFTLVGYLLATLHGLGSGTDTRTWWGFLLYGGSVALIGSLLLTRLLVPVNDRAKRHPFIAALTGVGLAALAVWAVVGPLQADWGARAGGSQSASAATVAATPSATTATDAYHGGFADTFSGTLAQTGPDGAGNTTIALTLHLNTTANGLAQVQIQGQQSAGGITVSGGTVALGTTTQPNTYQGTLGTIRGQDSWRITTTVSNTTARLRLTIVVEFEGGTAISGSISGTPA